MTAFIALVRKDILQYLGNRRALVMSLVAPVLIAAFFGSLFGSKSAGPADIPVALTDLDGSAVSRQVVAALQAEPALKLSLLNATQAKGEVQAGHVRAWVTLPAGFGAQAGAALLGGSGKPEIELVFDPSQNTLVPLLRGLLAQHAMQVVGRNAFGGADAKAGAGGPGLSLPFTLRETEAAKDRLDRGAGYNSYAHSFAGMGVQFILLLGVDIGIGLLAMRQLGLWKRLRAAPLSKAQLLGSRMASCAVIAFGVFVFLFVVAIAGFGVRVQGSLPGLLMVMAAYGVMTATFGLMLAAIGRTPEATRGLAILATLLMVMVGGAWVPSFIFPPWLQTVSAFTPTHWAVEGLDAMSWRGLPFSAALLPTGALLGFALLFGGFALARFAWDD
jgi:ABC-2 type transport system permease protein